VVGVPDRCIDASAANGSKHHHSIMKSAVCCVCEHVEQSSTSRLASRPGVQEFPKWSWVVCSVRHLSRDRLREMWEKLQVRFCYMLMFC
jgi:hypothetical protein